MPSHLEDASRQGKTQPTAHAVALYYRVRIQYLDIIVRRAVGKLDETKR